MTDEVTEKDVLERIARELKSIRELVTKAVHALSEAESEVPEKMRRFIMYMHDVHDIMNMYQSVGQEPPDHVKVEARRCDDRYRQILTELHAGGGTFEKVRREMAKDPHNRWEHVQLLPKPHPMKETVDETRSSGQVGSGIAEEGTDLSESEPGGGGSDGPVVGPEESPSGDAVSGTWLQGSFSRKPSSSEGDSGQASVRRV